MFPLGLAKSSSVLFTSMMVPALLRHQNTADRSEIRFACAILWVTSTMVHFSLSDAIEFSTVILEIMTIRQYFGPMP